MGTIKQLRYWAFKILPLVYDDSLSYYEVLSKVTNKLNEVINTTNELPEAISTEIEKQLKGDGDVFQNLFSGIVNAIATDEGDATYTANDKEGGELIWLNGTLYEVVRTMAAGTNYIVGTNIVPVSIDTELQDIIKTISSHNEYWNVRASEAHDTNTYLWWKGVLYRADADIKANDVLAIMATENGETTGQLTQANVMDEVTKHYLEMHEADNNLQTQIDGNDGDIEELGKTIKNNKNDTDGNIKRLDTRIDNIVAQSSTDNSEVVDARLGAAVLNEPTGTTYDSLGAAIRGQITSLYESGLILGYDNITSASFDFDDAVSNKMYTISAEGCVNAPVNDAGYLFTVSASLTSTIKLQLFFSLDTGTWYVRRHEYGVTYWDNWSTIDSHSVESYAKLSLFTRIGVIGDSYASGVLFKSDGSELGTYYSISWPQQLARKDGLTAVNFSAGGLSTRTWLTSSRGLTLLNSEDACQLYILALGINDRYNYGTSYIGSESDIGTDNDTFYGNYAKIIEAVQSKGTNVKMCICTIAIGKDETSSVKQGKRQFNTAIKNLATHYGIQFVDLNLEPYFASTYYANKYGGHPTASNYAAMATAYENIISRCMLENYSYFNDGDWA